MARTHADFFPGGWGQGGYVSDGSLFRVHCYRNNLSVGFSWTVAFRFPFWAVCIYV